MPGRSEDAETDADRDQQDTRSPLGPLAELQPNWDRPRGVSPPFRRAGVGGRRGFSGAGVQLPQSTGCAERLAGRPSDKCLVQPRADARWRSPRRSPERIGHQQSGKTPWKEEKLPPCSVRLLTLEAI